MSSLSSINWNRRCQASPETRHQAGGQAGPCLAEFASMGSRRRAPRAGAGLACRSASGGPAAYSAPHGPAEGAQPQSRACPGAGVPGPGLLCSPLSS